MSGGLLRASPARPAERCRGFTLIEMMIALVIVGIVLGIALPGYQSQIRRGSREGAQSQLIELAALQEKIFLNSNAYSASVSAAYTGASNGGLGVTGGKSRDGKYTLSATVAASSYTLTATPVLGGPQDGDGTLTITADGSRTWGSKSW